MKKTLLLGLAASALLLVNSCSGGSSVSETYQGEDRFTYSSSGCPQVKVNEGVLEGTLESGLKIFRGIPFAAPPVGDLRWKAPQSVTPWTGVREAKKFGDDPMQGNPFGDMGFNAEKKSEDCLYLNIWTPAKNSSDGLPSVIYFNGGGLYAGSGSEPRYAGEAMAREGIISITANYREGIFGFFAHPELSAETSYGGSGNWGFLDQTAAIKWVHDNIAAFGGDPSRITIVGESAGSMSVSAQIASPLTKGLFSKAMASSGSVTTGTIPTQEEADAQGVALLERIGVSSIAEARAMDADELMMIALDAGAEDMKSMEDSFEIVTQPEDYDAVEKALADNNIETVMSEITMVPDTMVQLSEEDAEKVRKTIDMFDDMDDVQEVYTNADLPDDDDEE